MGYRLNPAFWNRGLAAECVFVGCQYLKTCEIKTIHAYVMPENIASEKVLQKNGFVPKKRKKRTGAAGKPFYWIPL